MRGIFLMMKWFGKKARSHLFHCNRTKSTVKNPRVERYGSITDDELLAKVPWRTKPIKNVYFEVMAYTRGLAEMQEVKLYLEQKLHRPIVAYRHLDEAEEHAHFLAKNAGSDGKALRLAFSDFAEIKRQVARIQGRTVSPRGTGRRQVSLAQVRADPRVLQLVTDEYRATVAWVQRLFDLYQEYDAVSIAVVRDTDSYEIQRVDPKKPMTDQLLYRRLKALAARTAITFAPVIPLHDDRRLFRVLFLAAVPVGELHALPADALIVETGMNRFDVHIPLSEGLFAEEVTIAQRMLCGLYETDRGSIDAGHYRRLPGFAGVRVRDDIRPTGPQVRIPELEQLLKDQVDRQKAAAYGYRPAKKCWLDFFNYEDRNVSDRAYAAYLCGLGFSSDEIRCALLAESEDLCLRHIGVVQEYLSRTIWEARAMTHGDRALAALRGGVKRNGS